MVRRNLGRHLWLTLSAVLFSALPLFAQGGSMTGVVKDQQGKPVVDAKVTIDLPSAGRKYEVKTDKNGEYMQLGLTGGQYTLTVEKEGIGKVQRPAQVRAGARATYDVVLAPGSGVDPKDPKMAAITKTFEEGVNLSKAGSQDEAIAKFNEVIVLNPKCADCFYNIGYSEAQKKDYDKAEEAYKKAIELKPDYVDAYNGLAGIYNAQRKFDLAADASKKASEIGAPAGGGGAANPDSMFNEGVILWNAGKIADAKAKFQAVLAAKPDHAEAHYQLGMALVNEGNLAGAAEEFDQYLKLAPNGPNAPQAKALVGQLKK